MSEPVHDAERLKELQSLPLWRKVEITQTRIIEFYQRLNGNVYVSFSGGKDSTVLAYLVKQIYPNVPLVFSNTGLEYIEIQKFAKENGSTIIMPQISFKDVVTENGYPLISKDVAMTISRVRKSNVESCYYKKLCGDLEFDGKKSQFNKEKYAPIYELPFRISELCCNRMKKDPLHNFKKKTGLFPYVGTMASESVARARVWKKYGCNAFDAVDVKSMPLSIWTEQDVLHFIVNEGIQICSIYGDIVDETGCGIQQNVFGDIDSKKLHCTGCDRTGCMFCGFGMHLEKGVTRFQRMQHTHPKQYDFSINGGKWINNPDYDETLPSTKGKLKMWNPKQIWVPSEKGLGMGKVFDMMNEAMGKNMWRY